MNAFPWEEKKMKKTEIGTMMLDGADAALN